MTSQPFPPNFVWGVATASYQIEGAAAEDGRGPSIWDTFSHTPGAIVGNDTGDVACDHYHRFREDVAIMADLGVGTYRFSLAWPRFQADGTGDLNPAGIAFYDRLIDSLLENRIRPWVTLYHWDLPQALEDLGGWPERDTAYRFADYAVAVHERFADRVSDWTTLNEPWCSAFLGYASGVHAPGRTEPAAALRAAHHLMLGHGLAVEGMRSARPDLRYGVTLNIYPITPDTESPGDVAGARRRDGVQNRIFLDPILRGEYPQDVLADLARISGTEHIADGDLKTIAVPIDMLGLNYYNRQYVRQQAPGEEPELNSPMVGCEDVVNVLRGMPVTATGWEIDPTGLYDVLSRISREYPAPPLYVTENGAAFDDVVAGDGQIHDDARIAYLDGHFRQAQRAIEDGVDLRGYLVWSLLDNFEWALGYGTRFGIVHVDYATERRTIKDSGHWFARVIAKNAVDSQ